MPRNNTGLEDMAHSHSVYRIYENISLARKESRFRDGNGGVGKLVRRLLQETALVSCSRANCSTRILVCN